DELLIVGEQQPESKRGLIEKSSPARFNHPTEEQGENDSEKENAYRPCFDDDCITSEGSTYVDRQSGGQAADCPKALLVSIGKPLQGVVSFQKHRPRTRYHKRNQTAHQRCSQR